MTWPTSSKAGTTNVDAGNDLIRLARPDIKQNIDNTNAIIDTFSITSPSNNDILKYNSTSSKFENVAGGISNDTISIELADLASQVSSGTVADYTGGFTLTGRNDMGIVAGTDLDSAGDNFSTLTIPAGTYSLKTISPVYSGVYGSTAYWTTSISFKKNSDDSEIGAYTTNATGFYFRAHYAGFVFTLSNQDTIYATYQAYRGAGGNFDVQPLLLTRLA
jgi:hypothetical protein